MSSPPEQIGPYRILERLGAGGMGEVFLAYDRSTQQPLALKVVREESRMPGDDEALRQELLLACSVSQPNVCRVHDLAPSPWGPILVMERINGVSPRGRSPDAACSSFARSSGPIGTTSSVS